MNPGAQENSLTKIQAVKNNCYRVLIRVMQSIQQIKPHALVKRLRIQVFDYQVPSKLNNECILT